MSELGDVGDVPISEFRRQLHLMADWVADYRQNIEGMPGAPSVKPGEISARLPYSSPEKGESFDTIFADLKNIIIPGVLNCAHPEFLAYVGCTSTAPGTLGQITSSALYVNAMTGR